MELLKVENLDKSFLSSRRAKLVHAVNQVSFTVNSGEFVALVGESGSGKSTVAQIAAGLTPADSGAVFLKGKRAAYPYSREYYKIMQMVFQMPVGSFDPRWRIGKVLENILKRFAYPGNRRMRAAELLSMVGLPLAYLDKFPAQMSGGECQRAALARALAVGPELLICDEITSALDVSVQAQVIDLLLQLKEKTKISLLFISHDLALVQGISDRVLVMKDGMIVESGSTSEVLGAPRTAYTRQLIESLITIEDAERKATDAMKSQQLSFLRVIVNFQTFTFLFQKKLQTESGNDIIQVINKNVGEVSLVNKNSLYFSLKKAIHTFRLKSIFCRILVVLVVLILGICSLFYLVISSHYRESSQEHEINGNLAALNLIGNQMEDQILKSETQLEELLDLNVLETLASQEDIFSNPAALDIVQKLKKLADENPLIARAFLYTEQWDALLSSDQTVKPLDDTEEASVVAYCRAQKMENTIAMFNGNLYLFCGTARRQALRVGSH